MNRRLALAVSLVALTGCATIVKGTNQPVTVNSNVAGADVLLDGQKVGVTPFAGPVPKSKGMLVVQKPGYVPTTVALSKSLEPIFWGNIITGGTLGSITDFASGAAFQYAPASYQVDLKPEGQAQADFDQRVAARKFAMIYLDQISADLSRGQGDYLNALLAMVNLEKQGAFADAGAIRAALVGAGADPVKFGEAVVGLI